MCPSILMEKTMSTVREHGIIDGNHASIGTCMTQRYYKESCTIAKGYEYTITSFYTKKSSCSLCVE